MTIENLILNGQPSTHIFFRKENNVKNQLSEMKMLASQYIGTVRRLFFCMQGELFKNKFNLMSLSFYLIDHRRISLPHPLPFESVFLRVCAFEPQLWKNNAWKSVRMILDLWA